MCIAEVHKYMWTTRIHWRGGITLALNLGFPFWILFHVQLCNGKCEFIGKKINTLKMVEVQLAGDYPTTHTLALYCSNHQCWWSDGVFEDRIRLEELPLPVDWYHTGDGDPPKHCWYWVLWHSGTDLVTSTVTVAGTCVCVGRKEGEERECTCIITESRGT